MVPKFFLIICKLIEALIIKIKQECNVNDSSMNRNIVTERVQDRA